MFFVQETKAIPLPFFSIVATAIAQGTLCREMIVEAGQEVWKSRRSMKLGTTEANRSRRQVHGCNETAPV